MTIKEMDTKATVIVTSDLYFASYLHAVGCKIVKTENDGGKSTFHFQCDPKQGELKEWYFNFDEQSAIPALKYADSIRSLKTMCYVR